MKLLFILCSLTCGIYSCKSSKNITAKENVQQEKITTETLAVDAYRVVISFISFGAGPDMKLLREFKKYESDYAEKINKKITPEIYSWGREGESDYCFKLSELKPAEQKEFVLGVKKIFGDSKLVFLNENAKCLHKR